jgi:CBS domain-containing protein
VKVSEVMTAQVVTAKPTETIREVAEIMKRIDAGAVPVFDDGKVAGMVTDRDIVLRVVAEGGDLSAPISGVMTDDVQSCHQDDNVADAAAQMANHQLRRLIVTDDDGKLSGILSLGDIALDYGNKQVGHTLEEISAGSQDG